MSDWSDEETDQRLVADHRNFYKVEKWPRGRYTIRQRSRVLDEWLGR